MTERAITTKTTNEATCCGCGANHSTLLFAMGSSFLRECSICRLLFQSPLPSQAELDTIYENYYSSWNLEQSAASVSTMKKATFSILLERLPRSHTRGKLLDIGCATGEMLAVAQNKGFDVYGVEISPRGIELCQALIGKERLLGKPLMQGDFPDSFFDVITLCDVIEHIPDPPAFLNILANILKPHGHLVILTPDSASWTRKLLGRSWPHYKPEHLYCFNRSNLAKICSTRFEVLIADDAYKVLNLNYISGILQEYSRNKAALIISRLLKLLPSPFVQQNFKIHAGEMLMILRKL